MDLLSHARISLSYGETITAMGLLKPAKNVLHVNKHKNCIYMCSINSMLISDLCFPFSLLLSTLDLSHQSLLLLPLLLFLCSYKLSLLLSPLLQTRVPTITRAIVHRTSRTAVDRLVMARHGNAYFLFVLLEFVTSSVTLRMLWFLLKTLDLLQREWATEQRLHNI